MRLPPLGWRGKDVGKNTGEWKLERPGLCALCASAFKFAKRRLIPRAV